MRLPHPPARLEENPSLSMLAGLRVLDVTTSVAGPYAAQLLGDFGATVLKVEKPVGGDDARQWGPPFLNGASLWFLSVNRNKHSLTLDIAQPQGHEILMQLLAHTDVLILNMTPHVQAKLGLDHDRLGARFPRLIHASLTGFGLTGTRCDLPCYDLIAEGYSGVMDMTGEAQNDPQKVGTPAADLLAGQDIAMAVLAALYARQSTGKGSAIDVSMQASMTRFLAPRLVAYMGSGEVPSRSGGKDSVIAIYQVFDTEDAQLSLGLGNDAIWHRFWRAVGDPVFGSQPEYATNTTRRDHRATIVARIAQILSTHPRDHWLALFADHRIPAGPINRADEVVADTDLNQKGFFYSAPARGGDVPLVGLGIAFDGTSHVHRKSPPELGEDTVHVLGQWLGMSAEQIDGLRTIGII